MNNPDESATGTNQKTAEAALRSVAEIKMLRSREVTRGKLIALGHTAVIPLLHRLADPDDHVRWEAAKALAGIADPAAAVALAEALNDECDTVRWTAGEALVAIGWEGAKQVLVTLLRKSDTTRLCTAAHHVLSHFAKHKSGE